MGASELRVVEIESGVPFAQVGGGLLLTLVLGCLVGLTADLLTRDCQRKMVFFLLILSLMFGGGIAAVCGLEPVGVGLVAAVWLINTTLRRLDVLRVLKAGGPLMNGGIHFSGGWFLGCFLAQWGFDWRTTTFVFLAIVAIRPLAGLGAVFFARHLMPTPSLRGLRVAPATFLGTSDIALVAALIIGYLLPDPVGGSVVAGVVAAQWLLSICNEFFKESALLNAVGIPPAQPSLRPRL